MAQIHRTVRIFAWACVLASPVALRASIAPAQEPLQIAWAGPLTGDVAQLGRGHLNGLELAIAEWNERGGVLGRQIKLVTQDDACDPKQANTVAPKIADDPKNVLLVGHFCSGTTLAAGPIYDRAGLPMISSSSNPTITQQGWKNFFRIVASDVIQGGAIVNFSNKTINAKRFAILHDNQAMGEGVAQVAREKIKKTGGEITSFGGIEPKDFDYSAVLTKIIQAEKPDAILFCSNFPTSAGLIVKQSRALGFKKPILGCDGFNDPAMIKAAGEAADKKSDEEAVYFTFQSPSYTDPSAPENVKAFAARFERKFGSKPSGWELYGYDSGNLALNAIKAAGSTDKTAIVKVLHETTVPGVLIPEYRFDEKGDVVGAPLYVYTIEKGEFKLIERVSN